MFELAFAIGALWLLASTRSSNGPISVDGLGRTYGDGSKEEMGPPAPGRASSSTSTTLSVQTQRFFVTLRDYRSDQPTIEDLFRQAAVNGWYIGATGDGRAIIELRDVNIEDAWVRLLSLYDVVTVDLA